MLKEAAEKSNQAGADRRTIFNCKCCDRYTWGWNDGTFNAKGWHRIDNVDGPNAICPACVADPTSLDGLIEDGYENAAIRV